MTVNDIGFAGQVSRQQSANASLVHKHTPRIEERQLWDGIAQHVQPVIQRATGATALLSGCHEPHLVPESRQEYRLIVRKT
jgi:hypothetical protein